ncbi:MAG: hypothetical protein EHM20_02025 [Alphaproteobacteria bacterium]|nr:MAG: hypothetical protein EHM20_02025 [Alphaproteobacteria bacterium]
MVIPKGYKLETRRRYFVSTGSGQRMEFSDKKDALKEKNEIIRKLVKYGRGENKKYVKIIPSKPFKVLVRK